MASVIYQKASKPLTGNVKIPPSKSAAHRAILCAVLSKGTCTIKNVDLSKDISVTIEAAKALGATIHYDISLHQLSISAEKLGVNNAEIDCHESGSSLRFLIPIAAALGTTALFTGRGKLPERPLDIYHNLLPKQGVNMQSSGSGMGLPLTVSGQLVPGDFILPGNISSQFITGLLLALPLLHADSKILLSAPLESKSYVDLTIQIMKDFGINIDILPNGWQIKGNQSYRARDYEIEGDWSHAAFFLSIASFSGGRISIAGLRKDSIQGDRACIEEYRKFGLSIWWENDILCAENKLIGSSFHGLSCSQIDASQIPDLVPALAVCAAGCKGETTIYNAERLKIKECDRLQAMADAINNLGGSVRINNDGLTISGKQTLTGGKAEGMNDHRVLMALSATALFSNTQVEVTDAWSIQKSYPDFYDNYIALGGIADVINVG
ncbi:3-phosphoshikimate 1-carboxyvinyltransferase [Scatolibacter rhodanostii]|uniref:3-phosphoshikimate 1-carboxyvinyltransferase n=1 Tax=Scatolibacter rhodanostii TaxID=2014781 RepID=UPI000C0721DC|nr:3-phosphoshikimate 1-carboxyvinyltransferase [Scatolibacter rhodanostii]